MFYFFETSSNSDSRLLVLLFSTSVRYSTEFPNKILLSNNDSPIRQTQQQRYYHINSSNSSLSQPDIKPVWPLQHSFLLHNEVRHTTSAKFIPLMVLIKSNTVNSSININVEFHLESILKLQSFISYNRSSNMQLLKVP